MATNDKDLVSVDNGILGKIETGSKNGFLKSVGVLGVDSYYKNESTFVNSVYDMVRHRNHSHIKFELEYDYAMNSEEDNTLRVDTSLIDLYGISMTPDIENLRKGYTNFYGGLSSLLEKNDEKIEQNDGSMLKPLMSNEHHLMRDEGTFMTGWYTLNSDLDRSKTDYDKAKLTVYGPPEVYAYDKAEVKDSDGNFQNHDYKLTKYEFEGRSLERLMNTIDDVSSKRVGHRGNLASLNDIVEGTVSYIELSMKRQRGFDDVSVGHDYDIRDLEEIDRANKAKERNGKMRMDIGPAIRSAPSKEDRERAKFAADAKRNTQKYYELEDERKASKELSKEDEQMIDEILASCSDEVDALEL